MYTHTCNSLRHSMMSLDNYVIILITKFTYLVRFGSEDGILCYGFTCINELFVMLIFCYVRSRIEHRVKQLTEGLMSELQVSPERSLRGGPRAARRAVAQLIRLGKSAQVNIKIDCC